MIGDVRSISIDAVFSIGHLFDIPCDFVSSHFACTVSNLPNMRCAMHMSVYGTPARKLQNIHLTYLRLKFHRMRLAFELPPIAKSLFCTHTQCVFVGNLALKIFKLLSIRFATQPNRLFFHFSHSIKKWFLCLCCFTYLKSLNFTTHFYRSRQIAWN